MSNMAVPNPVDPRNKRLKEKQSIVDHGMENHLPGEAYTPEAQHWFGKNVTTTPEELARHERWLKEIQQPTQAEIDHKKKLEGESAKKTTLVDYKDASNGTEIDYQSYWYDMTPQKMSKILKDDPALAKKLMAYVQGVNGRDYYKQHQAVLPLFRKD
jgi:hypothetical protein